MARPSVDDRARDASFSVVAEGPRTASEILAAKARGSRG